MKDGLKEGLLNKVKVTDKFWHGYQELVMDTVIPYQEKILNDEIPGVEKSHALANFRIAAGLEEGEFYGNKARGKYNKGNKRESEQTGVYLFRVWEAKHSSAFFQLALQSLQK